jgi:serine/threonine protein kinase, bacterial
VTTARVRIGKYEVLTRLSVGGMAEVFLAVATGPRGFRKSVVLKSILPQHRDDHEFVEMFLDEARITAALSHSSIAQVFDLGQDDGELYLVMEFVAGRDVSTIGKAAARSRVALPVGFSCRVVHDACLALHYAHHFVDPGGTAVPVIHRDISPRNIMVTYAGGVKLIDFGIAKAKGLLERTQHGILKGSLGYMSPEQMAHEPLDARTDLFSAATVLHELLTMKRLYRVASDVRATAERLFLDAPVAPDVENPRVPKALSEVVLRALAREPSARYPSGKDMAEAIETAIGDRMFDDERTAELMSELFADDIKDVRRLLSVDSSAGSARMVEAANGLGDGWGTIRRHTPQTSTLQAPISGESGSVQQVSWNPGARAAETREPDVVLVVDDSELGRDITENYLTKAGFHVVKAESAEKALAMLAEMRPHVILLDVRMPTMNGFELCKLIRERHDVLTPILFVSAACSLEERTQGLDAGADDFVRKPYDPVDLVASIRGHLRRVAQMKASSSGTSTIVSLPRAE